MEDATDPHEFRSRVLKALAASDAMRLEERADRLIWLSAHMPTFGMLSGPADTLALIEEARSSFINGHLVATILTALASIERSIIGTVADHGVSCGTLNEAITVARERTLLPPALIARVIALKGTRNAFVHQKSAEHPESFGHRMLKTGRHPEAILEDDAKDAIAAMFAILKITVRPGQFPQT